MPKRDHIKELKVWEKAVKTLKAGEPVEVNGTTLYPELQDDQMELDLKSAERMVELCKRRAKNSKLKTGKVDVSIGEIDCGCQVDGKAYVMAQEMDIEDETLVQIFERIVKPRADRHKSESAVVTVRDIIVYAKRGLPDPVETETDSDDTKKDSSDTKKDEMTELREQCKALGVSARGGKETLLAAIEGAKSKADTSTQKSVNPLA